MLVHSKETGLQGKHMACGESIFVIGDFPMALNGSSGLQWYSGGFVYAYFDMIFTAFGGTLLWHLNLLRSWV